MAIVNELVTKFSFVGDLAPQRDFNENLKLSLALLTGFGAAVIGAAGGLVAFVSANTAAADALLDVSTETGISVESIQELGFAAELSGSSAEAMTASLAGLSKVSGDAARGLGKGKKAFEELGISVEDASGNVKTADVLFNELRESFARLGTDKSTQKSIIAALGLDSSTLQLLNATTEEIDGLIGTARQLGIVTTEQAQAAADFQDSLGVAKFAAAALSQQIAINLAPATQKITDGFVEFLVANQDLIKGGLQWLGEVIQATAGFFVRMTPIALALAGAFVVAQLATGGLATVMAFLLSPVVLITLAIVALLLIVDDLLTALDGGQSVIADFFMEFFGWDIVPVLQGIVDAFKAMFAALLTFATPFFEAFGHLFDAVIELFKGNWAGALDALLAAFNSAGEGIKNIFLGLFDFIGAAFSQILGGIKSAATNILPDWAVDLISTGGSPSDIQGNAAPLPSGSGQDPLDVPGSENRPIAVSLNVPPQVSQAGNAAPAPSDGNKDSSGSGSQEMQPNAVAGITPNDAVAMTPAGNTSVNNSQIKQDIKIDIASSDPKAAGAAVDNALQDQLKTAKTQVNRGGR